MGSATPALYEVAASAYGADFNDVKSGDNDFTGTNNGLYPAGSGYDMATGLGTPNATALVSSLCSHATVVGSPSVSATSLSGFRDSRPKLAFTVNSGTDAPALERVAIRLPGGLRFARGHGRVTVSGPNGRPTAFSSRIDGGALLITLRNPKARVRVTVSYPTIAATRHESALAKHGRAGKLPIGVTVTNSHGQGTRLTARIKPRS